MARELGRAERGAAKRPAQREPAFDADARRKAAREGKAAGRRRKPFLWAARHLLLAETYADPDAFLADYGEAKTRLTERRAAEAREAEEARARRAAAAMARRNRR